MTWDKDRDTTKDAYPPSGKSYEEKCQLINAIRARIISNDQALSGLLTFVEHRVVREGEFMYDTVAYTNGDQMYFCDRFFSQPISIMCAIVLHEMFHIVFRHVSRGRNRIMALYNVAADAIINDSIGYKQEMSTQTSQGATAVYLDKEHCVSLESVYKETQLPSEEQRPLHEWTAEALYEALIKNFKKQLEEQAKKEEEQKKQNGGENNDPLQDGSQPGDEDAEGDGDGEGEGSGQGQGQGSQGGGLPRSSTGSGSSGQQSGSGSGNSGNNSSSSPLGKIEKEIEDLLDRLQKKHKMFGGGDMQDVGDNNKDDPANQQINDAIWTERFNRAKAQGVGKNSILGKVNPDVYKPQIKWEKELRKFLVKHCMPETKQTMRRPSRRMSSLYASNSKSNRTYLAGITNLEGLDMVGVIIDTSGSCFNEEELTMFCTEIDEIQQKTGASVALVFADNDVEAEYVITAQGGGLLKEMKKGNVEAKGGGGTDMVTPFMYVKEKYRPIVTIVATDGWTPFPTRKQTRGTTPIWVINTEVKAPREAGRTLHIKPEHR